jgi:succinoglycan biosynthesis transport protein ExoP
MAVQDFEELDQPGLPPFVRDPLGVVRRRWRWMLATLLIGLIGTALLGLRLEPRYRAAAIVMIATKEMPEEFVRSTVQEDPFERISAMVGEILARPKLAALIEKHDLFPEERESVEMGELVTRVRENISIEPKQGITTQQRFETARLLSVEFENQRPDIAAAVANDIASLLAEAGIRLRSQQASLTTEFMRRELERAERALRDHDHKITSFKTQHRGELPADLTPSLEELSRLQ